MLALLMGLVVLMFAFALLLSPTYAEPGAGAKQDAKALAAPEDPDALAFFEDKVRPILDKRCVRCHGGEKVEGELNFATRELMLKGGVSGDVIDWDNHLKSLLLVAVNYTDFEYEMPPTGKLPQAEIDTLTKWVASGLPWTPGEKGHLADPGGGDLHGPPSIEEGKKYWAYKPVVKPDVPKVDDTKWAKHPIDALIYDKLAQNGLEPNVPADRIALIRRATYNLTGLPPTPEEVQAFVNDDKPGAWERVVDRLLDSPHYGEQWARHWMDIARYAETNGYERDGKKRNIWRYRDYLIRAFNSDTPYDRFVKEHIAGDLLPDRDAQSIIATGFNRLQIWDDEPTDRVQARADYIGDIVDTTTNAFLATTVACAKCHDHKKDPITQSDYFAFYAFFNNIMEPQRGRDDAISMSLRDPVTDGAKQAEVAAWDQRVGELKADIATVETTFSKATNAEYAQKKGKLTPIAADSEKQHQSWRYQTTDQGTDWYLQQFDDRGWPEAKGGFAYGVKRPNLPNNWNSENIYLRRVFRVTEEPKHLTLSITSKDSTEVYINGILVYQRKAATGPRYQKIQLPAEALNALVVGSNSLAVKSNKGTDGLWFIDVGVYAGVVDPLLAKRAMIDAKGEAVLGKETLEQYKVNRSELDNLLARPIAQAYPAMVLSERNRSLPKQQIHERGSANALGEDVPARFPLVLGGAIPAIPELPADLNASGRRLALANWLASPDNPLSARVMVNRIWQHQFGRGIVRSSSDFGKLGELPTHPELLDFLAATFIEQGWSIKQFNKFIMMSSAYQMSSSAQKAGLEIDPTNNLFWRFDMRRLTAEEFRDSLLAVNGSLNPKQFGPSIYTKMPKEVLATASRPGSAWGVSSEADRDRRSVYIHIKRSLREPLLAALDQAATDTPCPVRFATTVPTQSLITLNSEMMQDEAVVFATRLQKEAGPALADQIRLGLKLVLMRQPTDKEVESNVAFVKDMMKAHGLDNDRALKLFCLVAYNLNEFIYLD
ncbi:MAG: PSD1 and planctomycete cytochrome C domain-containing protein [Phycisphaeraceae bacterium]